MPDIGTSRLVLVVVLFFGMLVQSLSAETNVYPAEVVALRQELVQRELELQRLVDQLKRLLSALEGGTDLTAEVARAKGVLMTIRPAAESGATVNASVAGPEPTLESARVLEVNPNLRLVVLNVGLLHGVRVGMPFVVLQGDRVVAELKVVEVRRRICGALIEKVDENATLAAGDAARVTKS